MTVDRGRPAEFAEDDTWLPAEGDFARYPADADLGLLYTDGQYDVVVFEDIGPPAQETFERMRHAKAADHPYQFDPVARGGTEPDRLDDTLPLLVLSRRGDVGPFAAVQRWEQISELIEQDRPRRARGQRPPPDLQALSRPARRPALGWIVRSFLTLAALAVGALAVLIVVDADGPVGLSVTDATTSANPFLSGSRLHVMSGGEEQWLPIPSQGTRELNTLAGVRWALDEPLVITYLPSGPTDESHTVILRLRDQGATVLNRGSYVRIALDISDTVTLLTITQPTQRLLTSESTIAYQVSLARGRTQGDSDRARGGVDMPDSTPGTVPPVVDPACVAREVSRYAVLTVEFDLLAQYDAAARRFHDAGDSVSEALALAEEMRVQASDLEDLLAESGFLASRPANSPLLGRFDQMLALQRELRRAWQSNRPSRVNDAYADFKRSASFLGSLRAYLENDARVLCR